MLNTNEITCTVPIWDTYSTTSSTYSTYSSTYRFPIRCGIYTVDEPKKQ